MPVEESLQRADRHARRLRIHAQQADARAVRAHHHQQIGGERRVVHEDLGAGEHEARCRPACGASAMLSGDQPYRASVSASAKTRSPLAICGSHSFFWASLAASSRMRAQSTAGGEERTGHGSRAELLEEHRHVGQGIAGAAVLLRYRHARPAELGELAPQLVRDRRRIAVELDAARRARRRSRTKSRADSWMSCWVESSERSMVCSDDA